MCIIVIPEEDIGNAAHIDQSNSSFDFLLQGRK